MRIKSFNTVEKIAIKEFIRTRVELREDGKLHSKLNEKEIGIWHEAFMRGYCMGQENVDNSDHVILITLLRGFPK